MICFFYQIFVLAFFLFVLEHWMSSRLNYSFTGGQMLPGTCSLCSQNLLNVRLCGCRDKGTWACTCWKPHGQFRYVVLNGDTILHLVCQCESTVLFNTFIEISILWKCILVLKFKTLFVQLNSCVCLNLTFQGISRICSWWPLTCFLQDMVSRATAASVRRVFFFSSDEMQNLV